MRVQEVPISASNDDLARNDDLVMHLVPVLLTEIIAASHQQRCTNPGQHCHNTSASVRHSADLFTSELVCYLCTSSQMKQSLEIDKTQKATPNNTKAKLPNRTVLLVLVVEDNGHTGFCYAGLPLLVHKL